MTILASLGALLHPAIAGFAALLAIPLIIHLLNRRRFRTVPWAAMEFLLQAYKKRRKRLELENLLLLLLRCAIPVVLAFAFARPYFGADSMLAPLAEPRREVVLVLDDSYSMDRRAGTGTQFQTALEQARRLVAGLQFERGDRISLVTLAKDPQVLCVSAGKGDVERRLASLQRPSYEPADLGRTLDLLLDDVLKQIPAAPELWLVSDFQRVTFDEGAQRTAADEATHAAAPSETTPDASTVGKMQRLSQQCRLHLVNLSDGTLPAENAAVTDLRASEPLAIAGQAIRITATVARSSKSNQATGSGHFRIGDSDRPVSFRFDSQGRANPEIYHSCTTPGDVGIEFRVDEDELADDDARFLRLPVKNGLPVLIVDGDPAGENPLSGGAQNLLLILDPNYGDAEAAEDRRWFEPTVIPHYELSRTKPEFSKYDAVVFVNVRNIDAEKVLPELQSYVDAGGGALFFLGDKLRPQDWNEHLFKGDGSGLMPLRIANEPVGEEYDAATRATASADNFFRLEIADELHPAVRTFNDDRRRNFLSSPIFKIWPFEADVPAAPAPPQPPSSPNAPAANPGGAATPPTAAPASSLTAASRVILRYKAPNEFAGAPALIDHRYGRGRTLWFNVSGADDPWSTFTVTPSAFFPLVWDMLNFLCVRDPGEHDLAIGGAISRGYPSPALSWMVTSPGGQTKTTQSTSLPPVRGLYRVDWSDTKVPGLYSLDVQFGGEDPPVHELFAVNVDPRESQLDFLDREQVRSLYERAAIASYGHEIAVEAQEQQPERQGEIWKKLVLFLLILVVLETILAWRFGSYSS